MSAIIGGGRNMHSIYAHAVHTNIGSGPTKLNDDLAMWVVKRTLGVVDSSWGASPEWCRCFDASPT